MKGCGHQLGIYFMQCTKCCMKPVPINAGAGQGFNEKRKGVRLAGKEGDFFFFAVSQDWH